MEETDTFKRIKEILDKEVAKHNTKKFIDSDPIQIPHLFSRKEDIEISAFLTSVITWGKREMIIPAAKNIIYNYMGNSPYEFIINHKVSDLKDIRGCIYRTFQAEDLIYYFQSLQNIYLNHKGLEDVLSTREEENDTYHAIERFRKTFFELSHMKRVEKHIGSPEKKSAAKKINMFLRWMVRNDGIVDFGIWKKIKPFQLVCPLDIHVGRQARNMNIITSLYNNWQTAIEISNYFKLLDPKDPIKYDFALFGIGIQNNNK